MRPAIHALAGALALATVGCVVDQDLDVCEEAEQRFLRCGVTVPLFDEEASCSAAREAIAECVLELSESCSDLSSWLEHVDQCAVDFGDELEPLEGDNDNG